MLTNREVLNLNGKWMYTKLVQVLTLGEAHSRDWAIRLI